MARIRNLKKVIKQVIFESRVKNGRREVRKIEKTTTKGLTKTKKSPWRGA